MNCSSDYIDCDPRNPYALKTHAGYLLIFCMDVIMGCLQYDNILGCFSYYNQEEDITYCYVVLKGSNEIPFPQQEDCQLTELISKFLIEFKVNQN